MGFVSSADNRHQKTDDRDAKNAVTFRPQKDDNAQHPERQRVFAFAAGKIPR